MELLKYFTVIINDSSIVINNMKQYKYITYYVDSIREIFEISNDKLNGKFIVYHENGKTSALGKMKNGLLDGKYFIWNLRSKLVHNALYKNGEIVRLYR